MRQGKILDKNGDHINLKINLHPGEVLNNELDARKITKRAFAIKVGMYLSQLSEILQHTLH